MASPNTPKSLGEPIGKVLYAKGKTIRIATSSSIANGDGLSYFNQQGEYMGFRVNRVDGSDLILTKPISIAAGTPVFRTYDKALTMRSVDNQPNAKWLSTHNYGGQMVRSISNFPTSEATAS